MAAQYVAFIMQFVVSVVISRWYLTPAEFGVFSIALSVAMLVAVLQDFGLARYISGEPELSTEQIRACYSVSLLFSFTIGLLILGMAWPVSWFYHDPRLVPLLVVVAASYLVVPFSIVPAAMLMRNMDFRSLFIVNVGSGVANAITALTLAAHGYGAISLAWALVAQAAAKAVLSQWLSGVRLPWPLSLGGAGPILRFGSASSALFISGSVGTRTPELIIGRLLNFTAVGLYGRAASVTGQLFQLIAGALGGVFYPAFRRLRDEGVSLAPGFLRVMACSTAIVWASMTGLALAAEPLVNALYGPKWIATAPLLSLIALGQIGLVTFPLAMELPILLGRIKTLIRLNVLDTLASVTLLAAGCVWGVEWAAASRIVYSLVWALIYARFMQELIGFAWRDVFAIYVKSALGAIAAAVPLALAYRFWAPASAIGMTAVFIAAGLGVLCWIAALALTRHPALPEFIAMARPLLNRVPVLRRIQAP